MNIEQLQQGDKVQYIDRDSVARNGRVVRNRTTEQGRLFLTVEDTQGRVEVIRDQKKVTSIG